MSEEWKDIEGYEGLYQISNCGRVKSLKYGKERILKPFNNKGYLRVQLCKNGKCKSYLVHRLVAEAFLYNPDNYKEINHKNEIKTDNRVENLEWCDTNYNVNYGTRNKRIADKHSKTVCQYTLDGELVKEYPSTREIERQLGYDQGNISACCLGKFKTSYGYIWRYRQ